MSVSLLLGGEGKSRIRTPLGMLTHMLEQVSKHSIIDMIIDARGDTWIDEHHTIEDTGIVIGMALKKALGNKAGIRRFGWAIVPTGEALALVSIDLAGRHSFVLDADFARDKVGDLPTESVYDFFDALAQNSGMTLNIRLLSGRNDHHRIEAIFKCFGVALRMAAENDFRQKGIPSTKSVL
ncbi:MAG: imidazoleglycerol-phosphate dehydratase HisB [Candidatus Woesearchaeota archaeon]